MEKEFSIKHKLFEKPRKQKKTSLEQEEKLPQQKEPLEELSHQEEKTIKKIKEKKQ